MGWVEGFGGGRRLTMRSASALRFSKGCSSLNLDRMVTVEGVGRRGSRKDSEMGSGSVLGRLGRVWCE